MAHHKSALKRILQNERRRVRNKHVKSSVRTGVRHVREAIKEGQGDEARTRLKLAISQLNRAASKGIIPKKRASRLISRLTKGVNAI